MAKEHAGILPCMDVILYKDYLAHSCQPTKIFRREILAEISIQAKYRTCEPPPTRNQTSFSFKFDGYLIHQINLI